MPPNHTVVHGRAALEDYFRERFSGTRFRFSFTFSDIQLAGDLAFEHLAYTALAWPAAGGQATEDTGKGLRVSPRQPDGSWKVALDIWHSDSLAGSRTWAPLPATASPTPPTRVGRRAREEATRRQRPWTTFSLPTTGGARCDSWYASRAPSSRRLRSSRRRRRTFRLVFEHPPAMCVTPLPRRSLAEETPPLESESAEDGSPRPAAVVDSRPGSDLTDARTHPGRHEPPQPSLLRRKHGRQRRQRARQHSVLHLGRLLTVETRR